MLEAQRIRIEQRNPPLREPDDFVLTDLNRKEIIGFAREQTSRLQRWIGWFFGQRWRSRTWDLREITDDCLVATIHRRAYWFWPVIEVQDSTGVLVGTVHRLRFSWRRRYGFRGPQGVTLATARLGWQGNDICIMAGESDVTIATIQFTQPREDVLFQDDLAGQYFLKMLIVGWAMQTLSERN